jgi:hypothetical protein
MMDSEIRGARLALRVLFFASGVKTCGRKGFFACSGYENKKARLREPIYVWCPEEDSNLHTLRHTDLNRARLPIPPSGPEYLR